MILRTKNERYRKNIKAQEKYHLERIKDEGPLLDNEPELCKEWDYKKTPNNLLFIFISYLFPHSMFKY